MTPAARLAAAIEVVADMETRHRAEEFGTGDPLHRRIDRSECVDIVRS